MSEREIQRDEAEAALQTRHDLGRDYEPAIVDSFVERIDRAIEARVADEVAKRVGDASDHDKAIERAASDRANHRLALSIVSLALSVPLTAIALGTGAGMSAVVLIWTAIVAVNLIFALSGLADRRRR
jgi:hypothetical protein